MRARELLLILALVLLCGCRAGEKKMVVLTSFQPLYSIAWHVAQGSERVEVRNLASREVGPHDYRPAGQAFEKAARDATAIVTLRSVALAPEFDRLYAQARRHNIRIVELDLLQPDTPALIDGNPHVWLSLAHAALMVDNLAGDLARLDPAGADRYRRNATRYKRKLLALRAEYAARFAELEAVAVASRTDGFPYLLADMGLRQVPEGPEARAVLVERGAGPRLLRLSTLEAGWGDGPELRPEGYLAGMRDNLARLYRALRGER